MLTQPLLSVIVPVYNTAKYLPRSMESLNRQTYRNLEIILVDDGSTDDSSALCDRFAQESVNIRVIHKKNAGLGYARNSGLDVATGQYVTFLDSDDYVHEDMYAAMMAQIADNGADGVYCDFCLVKKDGRKIFCQSSFPEGKYPATDILLGMLGSEPEAKGDFDFEMSVCKGIYSLELIRSGSMRFVSERDILCEDLVFNIAYLKKAKSVAYVKRSFYFYCENEGSLTHRNIADRLNREKDMYIRICETEGSGILGGKEMLRWQRLFLGRIRATAGQYVRYARKWSFGERLHAIGQIAGDELVRSVISGYPFHRNPLKLRIFNMFLKHRFCLGMYLLIVLNR